MDITFILGLLSLIQITFLPGFLVSKVLKIEGFIKTLVLSFGLSLIINHFLIFGLTALGIYKTYIIYFIFGIELLLIKLLGFDSYLKLSNLKFYQLNIIQEFKQNNSFSSILRTIVYLGCLAVVALFLVYMATNIGNIFHTGDDVVSWNKWAVQWSGNSFPAITWHYPQLLPANWSISYVFMKNSNIQFFAKFIMPLFSLFTLLLMLDLAFTTKKTGFFIAVIATGLIIESLCSKTTIQSGYVDLAVAFFAFSSIYCLIKARFAEEKNKVIIYFILGSFFCIGASVTKQAGLYIEILYPLFAYLLVFRNSKLIGNSEKIKLLLVSFFFMFVLSSVWYVYKEIQIVNHIDDSEISYVTNAIHNGKTYFERFMTGIDLLKREFGDINIYFVFIFMFLSILTPLTRWLFLLIIMPFILIWAIFYSYDIRNVTLALPFMGLCYGFGISFIIEKLKFIRFNEMFPLKNSFKTLRISNVIVLFLTITILFTLNLILPGKYLLNIQADKEIKFIGKTSIKR